MKKRALLVGINYVGTSNQLKGCVNDSHNMQVFLSEKGFTDIRLVLDAEATTAGIIDALNWLITDAAPGDVIVFHYSGHGSQLPSKNEPDGFEEIICPINLNWIDKVITDATLRDIFNKVPNGVNTTVILDCCHSGTMLNQIESLDSTKDLVPVASKKEKNARYMKPPAKIVRQLTDKSLVDWQASKDVNATALLIAGCHANQTSADAFIDGVPQGAATAALLKIARTNASISYRNLVTSMTGFMSTNKYTQIPELDGSPSLYDQTFLEPFNFAIAPDILSSTTNNESNHDKTRLFILIGLVIAVIAFFVLI